MGKGLKAIGDNNMDKTTAFFTYLNMLTAKYNMWIDWDNTDLEKRELNFCGGTDEQQMEFIQELDAYCRAHSDEYVEE